jgi:ubiquinone/menaquinone biosynthesis C-methylase UbiE
MALLDRAMSSRAAYDLWAEGYPPVAHNALMHTEQALVAGIILALTPVRALDVGTGSGRYLPILTAAGASTVVGLDFSPAMLSRVSARGSSRVRADARRLPFADAIFDLVNASLVAGDVQDLDDWTDGLARVLTAGGHLVYSDFHPSWARHGWRRTFQAADGRTVDLPYVPHAIGDHLRALRCAGFTRIELHEARLRDVAGAPLKEFSRAWGDPPALVVAQAVKGKR